MKTFNYKPYIVRLTGKLTCSGKLFSTSARSMAIDPNNGLSTDSTTEIVDACQTSAEVEKYFETKEESVKRSYREESNSASWSGVSVRELDNWLQLKNSLLEELVEQKLDVYDQGEYTDNEGSDAGDEDDMSEENTAEKTNTSDNGNEVSNETENADADVSSSFPQDSSDVVQTDFDVSDYYDD